MVEQSAGGRGRLPLVHLRALATGVLAFAVGLGLLGNELTGTSEAYSPTRPATSPQATLAPTAATGEFGLDLLRAQPPGNVVLSPDSIATALAMAGTGARGRTATEIAQTLHLGKPAAFAAVGSLQRTIAAEQTAAAQGDPEPPTLNLANGLFLQQGFAVKPMFQSGLKGDFGADPQLVDFWNDPTGSVQAVNSWVSEQTSGVIPELFDSLPKETRLVLANAVYMTAKWRDPFATTATSSAPFHNRRVSTPAQFMHQTDEFLYGSSSGYQAVELPYRASTLSMLVVLPRDKELGAFQHTLSAKDLARIVGDLSLRRVSLSLPRFHLNTHTSLDGTLKELGMTTAFGERADFSGVDGGQDLKIDKVVHAADIEVDEGGTVAAAATGVTVIPKSKPRPPVRFNADHPFLFFLRDRRTGAVLFAGRLVDAASAAA
jgi:serine protease inhibitor